MELWVRSQDKEKLVRPTNLKIDYENQLYVILSKCNYRYRLGYYKTKERALEVLDEINRHIEELYNCKYGIEYDLPQFTYEMPKE